MTVVNDFIDELLASFAVSMKKRMQLDLVVEEIFVNIAHYAYGEQTGKAYLQGTVSDEPTTIELIFCDEGIPYNPLEQKDPNIEASVEERQIGGLGIFLVKKNVDNIAYEYKDGKNILTIKKNL